MNSSMLETGQGHGRLIEQTNSGQGFASFVLKSGVDNLRVRDEVLEHVVLGQIDYWE